jgi:hypothetical protein
MLKPPISRNEWDRHTGLGNRVEINNLFFYDPEVIRRFYIGDVGL